VQVDERLGRIKTKMGVKTLMINPPLTEADIARFEAQHRLELPEAYRAFLLQIGNGGDGPPEYGIPKLGKIVTHKTRQTDAHLRACYQELRFVREPFPLVQAWVWEDEIDTDETVIHAARCHGHLYLGTEGCGLNWVLIVTGPERGLIWQIADEGAQPTIPRRDFLTWYEDWLDGIAPDGWWDSDDGESENTVQHTIF
jgi:hypothetical protein